MDRTDYRSKVIAALKAGGRQVKMNGDRAQFRCVRHDDTNPSAWLGEWKWGCSSCGFEESIDTLAEHLGVEKPTKHYTVEDYAAQKGFSLELLQKWGVHTKRGKFGNDVVAIPYRLADGIHFRTKVRTPGNTFWDSDGTGTMLYGLDMLEKAKPADPVVLVEGESDCHAGWHKGILTLGIPGANGWKREWASLLSGRDVYVWQEPDTEATKQAAAKMVEKIKASIPGLRVIKDAPAKDLADLYKRDPKTLRSALKALMDSAASTTVQSTPVISSTERRQFTEVAGSRLDEMFALKQKPVDAVPTAFPKWSDACRDQGGGIGVARGWHCIIAGNTGFGKSGIALNNAKQAILVGERVCFISLEMSWEQLSTRFLSIVSGEPVNRLEWGSGLDAGAHHRASALLNGIKEDSGGSLWCNERHISNLSDIHDAIRFQYEVNGCRYVITDYMQLADVAGVSDRIEAITRVSHEIRNAAQELRIVSVGLSQFNRETSKNYDNPPTVQGLMGGSPLENDSDQVLLIDHSHYEKDPLTKSATQRLLLAKNRHGPTPHFMARWDYRTLQIEEIAEAPAAVERSRYERSSGADDEMLGGAAA